MSCIDYTIPETVCKNPENNNQSDRQYASNSKMTMFRVVPRNPNSIRRTKTSLKPGALCPGGKGVDVKHNSYDRYLARKKQALIIKDKERSQKANAMSVPSCNYCN
jgi:hypothetical protein